MQLDRRHFLAISSALTLTSALPAVGAPPRAISSVARTRAIKKALKIGMIKVGSSLREKFQIAKDAGFDGVELNSPSDLSINEALEASEATGIELPGVVDSVHWHEPLSDPDAKVRARGLRGLETALRDCKALGGTTVLLVPAIVNGSVSYAEAYERSQTEIRKLLPLAAELQIKIAIENVWNHFLLSPLEAARYVDEFESPWIGWYFDVGNIVNYGWPEHWVRTLGKRILKLDIKEFSRKLRDDDGLWNGFRAKLTEGDCNWPEVMRALDDVGYAGGWGSAEVSGGDAQRLADIARRMDRIFAS